MHTYYPRFIENDLKKALKAFPVVAILGPRQCGKSTLAKQLLVDYKDALFLDLERPSDLLKLEEAEFYLEQYQDRLVCIDEIQRAPNLFPLIRALVDSHRTSGRFLILGSASQNLIQQSSESLAGRITYYELAPFISSEVKHHLDQQSLWIQGGFPDSVLNSDLQMSLEWRKNFIRTFLERDLGEYHFQLSSITMRRFWRMLTHFHGQQINYSKLGQALDVSHTTIRRWVDLFEQTFMVRVLSPYQGNLKKRLVKSPKVYLRDSGILHSLLEIESFEELMGNPLVGASWEGFIVENILSHFPKHQYFYYRTSSGEEIDLILERKGKRTGIEIKLSKSPKLSKSIQNTYETLNLESLLVVIPGNANEWIRPNIKLVGLDEAIEVISHIA